MQLRVAAPVGDGWQVMESGPAAGGLLAAIRCIHGTPPSALALNAYAYAVPDGEQRTVAQLCRQNWRGRWQGSTFSTVESVDAHAVERPGADPACEVCVAGRGGPDDGPLRVREQHVPSGARRLVVSVAGPPDLHQTFAAVIDQWLVHAALGA